MEASTGNKSTTHNSHRLLPPSNSSRINKHPLSPPILFAAVLQHDHSQDHETTQDFKIVQHLSPACRASRSKQLYHLPAAAVLRSLHDADYETCRQHSLVSTGGAALLLILIPVFLATISTSYCTNLMDMFIYTSLDLFLLVTYVISLISVPVITICCASIGGYIIYYYGVFAGAVRNASRLGKTVYRYIQLAPHPNYLLFSGQIYCPYPVIIPILTISLFFSPLFPYAPCR